MPVTAADVRFTLAEVSHENNRLFKAFHHPGGRGGE